MALFRIENGPMGLERPHDSCLACANVLASAKGKLHRLMPFAKYSADDSIARCARFSLADVKRFSDMNS